MAIFKCKMCGGTLEINNNETVAVCEYCGTKQTLPKSNDEVVSNLFNRANNLRLKCEFDKAEQVYEKILEIDNTEAETHWGIVLCKYGIEYVEDPKTYTRIPTCHRTSYDSIFADSAYLSAIANADGYQKVIYEEEAKKINDIQRGILSIVKNEKPFDVFICYKETDESGQRTVDSTIANDIYHQLTNEGFKVFYSAITLEDKLGEAYEPYIFAALNSAKVMLVIGTKPEYFEAVWVKNEWSRFLKLIKTDHSKLLIPCYRNMDAYDLPEEFSHLQSQDMSKIGFINDIERGIKKVLAKDTAKAEPVVVTQATATTTNIAPLLKRAFMFLEDGDFARADEFCEQVLNLEPECAEAYLGKLMSELKVSRQEDLGKLNYNFTENANYQKAFRFADNKLKSQLDEYATLCKEIVETNRKDSVLNEAKSHMVGNDISTYESAINLLETIRSWKDSQEQILICKQKIEEIKVKEEQERIESEKQKKKKKIITAVVVSIVAIIVAFSILLVTVIIPKAKFKDIVAISAGDYHTVGLKSDGTVVATGYNGVGQCNVSDWTDIVAVSAGNYHTVGLKSDGTVVATGNNDDGQCNVSDWTDIVAISASDYLTVALKSDGTVVAVGNNYEGQCNLSGWTDIVAISASYYHTVALKSDGTVVAVGYNSDGQCLVGGKK